MEIEKQGCDAGETERHKGGDYEAGEVACAPLGLAQGGVLGRRGQLQGGGGGARAGRAA